MNEEIIKNILINNKITDYLENKGIYPEKKAGKKILYLCPIHGEKSPSFVVYPEGYKGQDFQSFHCFGCGAGSSIFNLISKLENLSFKSSFSKLASDVSFKDVDLIDEYINKMKKDSFFDSSLYKIEENDIEERDSLYFSINYSIREHIENTGFDPEEIYFFEKKVVHIIDKIARDGNIEALRYIENNLSKCFLSRVNKNVRAREEFLRNNPWK